MTDTATKKELEAAWEVHDHSTKEVDLDENSCAKRKDFSEKLGHSRFNPACQAWVLAYANSHPIERQVAPPSKKVVTPRRFCDVCKQQFKEPAMWQEELFGKWVCSKKCQKKAQDGATEGPIPFSPSNPPKAGLDFKSLPKPNDGPHSTRPLSSPVPHVHGPGCSREHSTERIAGGAMHPQPYLGPCPECGATMELDSMNIDTHCEKCGWHPKCPECEQ